MKNIYKLITLLFGLLALSSCEDYLDQKPISEIGDNGFYTNDAEMETAVIAIYDGFQNGVLREFALTEMRSDNSRTKNSEGEWAQFEDMNVESTNATVSGYWTGQYNVIFRANTVLKHLEVVSDESLKNQYEGEALFARALSHFNLVRLFGDVPLIDKVIIQSESDYFGRVPSNEVYDFIVDDLTMAAAKLPAKGDIATGRATSGAAKALLAKVYLTIGQHAEAKTLLDQVIASNEYQLVGDYHDIFYNELNDEILFAIEYLDDNTNDSQDFSLEFTALGLASGLNYATNNLTNAFSVEDSIRSKVAFNQENTLEVGKFITASSDATLCGNDWIVLRYADVLLMHAEAIMAGGNATTDGAALASFNEVRVRAGLPEVTEITKEMLLNERRFELAFENQRWFDLNRFGVAEQVLSAFASEEGFTFSNTALLLPIPQREIDTSKDLLVQNPGY
ncbi:RagB/SusD family nutrient uptake outer membrane protein [Flexithrix dorotheae]|uniref:RagB/SusD family nutrient uptake outer membrane protein n=1 Tax=Flexithrix dorotheae TaxID=70993 RepID=UPI00037F1263|nr:RagB/SusD family nutrient uptake outer membrane protein [Flexithrix dorotheae]